MIPEKLCAESEGSDCAAYIMLALAKMRATAKAARMVVAVQKVMRPIHESFFVLKVSP